MNHFERSESQIAGSNQVKWKPRHTPRS